MSFAQNSNVAQARWARGNAWITIGILYLLEIIPIDNGVRLYLLECPTTRR
ncbi:MAG: glycoside hydrolase family 88 protein [Symbiopectobacterium sp.]